MKLTLRDLDYNDRKSFAGASETAKIATFEINGGFEFILIEDGENEVIEVAIYDEYGNGRIYSKPFEFDLPEFFEKFEKTENEIFPIFELLESSGFTLIGY